MYNLDLISEPWEHYFGRAGEYVTSHLLIDYMNAPPLYSRKVYGNLVGPDTHSKKVGRALHTQVLEGEQAFRAQYATDNDAPVNPKTGKPYGHTSQRFTQWAESQDREILTASDMKLLVAMSSSISAHRAASTLLAHPGVDEGVLRATLWDMKCQARIDWFSYQHGIVDLKTCKNLDLFERDFWRYKYHVSMAFYRLLAGDMPVHMIAVEKQQPFRVGVWEIDRQVLRNTEPMIDKAMNELKESIATGAWPTGYESVRTIAAVD